MCGIIGMIGNTKENRWNETHRILTHLFLSAETRGRDATGFVAQPDPLKGWGDGRIVTDKEPIRSSQFVDENPAWRGLKHRRCSMVLGHVRWATHGDPADPQNNHPHISGHLALVHNGILTSHRDLADKFCLRLKSDCDSEVLLRIIERSKSIPMGMSICLREGPGSIVVYDSREHCLWLGRDESRPLWICKIKNDHRLFFASTPGILIHGIQSVMTKSVAFELLLPLAPYFVYRADMNGSIETVCETPMDNY